VLETNVHYPTDCNLLWDAARKSIELSVRLCEALGLDGWRKSRHWRKRVKSALRRCDKAAYRGGAGKSEALEKATVTYLDVTRQVEGKTAESLGCIGRRALSILQTAQYSQLVYFHGMLVKHIDLVERRLLKKEVIAHEEKIFSLFEPHTELIKKGKMMPPVEFGHRLLVSSEQHGLIIDYKIMEAGVGEPGELEPLMDRLESRFGEGAIESLSVDQGFSNMALRQRLEERIDLVIMPKKGRRSAASRERENAPEWIELKNRHAAVESDINALEQCGLNRCPDKGLRGYRRYAGLGVLAYNLHKIGKALLAAQAPEPAKRPTGVRRRAA
jgi:IS5 family transposase